MNLPDVMTIDELAGYLQLSKSTLYKLAQEGKVPGQKVGKHWRFHKDAIDDWLKTGQRAGRGDLPANTTENDAARVLRG